MNTIRFLSLRFLNIFRSDLSYYQYAYANSIYIYSMFDSWLECKNKFRII